MTGEVAIRAREVSHHFGDEDDARHVRALLHTSIDVARGELLCLIGPSGCGKSTLLNVMGGLLTPSSGVVEVGGKPVRGRMPADLAYVFQENALFPWNTVFENVMEHHLALEFHNFHGEDHAEAARAFNEKRQPKFTGN